MLVQVKFAGNPYLYRTRINVQTHVTITTVTVTGTHAGTHVNVNAALLQARFGWCRK